MTFLFLFSFSKSRSDSVSGKDKNRSDPEGVFSWAIQSQTKGLYLCDVGWRKLTHRVVGGSGVKDTLP